MGCADLNRVHLSVARRLLHVSMAAADQTKDVFDGMLYAARNNVTEKSRKIGELYINAARGRPPLMTLRAVGYKCLTERPQNFLGFQGRSSYGRMVGGWVGSRPGKGRLGGGWVGRPCLRVGRWARPLLFDRPTPNTQKVPRTLQKACDPRFPGMTTAWPASPLHY